MSLLQSIATATGGEGSANYFKSTSPAGEGATLDRTVIKISRAVFREANADLPRNSFRIDGEILKSTCDVHSTQVGFTGTLNLRFAYPKEDLANMRKMLSVAGTAAGIGKGAEGAMDEAEAAARVEELIGQAQPLVGTIVTVIASTKNGKQFTHYKLEVPTERDLDGVLPPSDA